MAKYQRLTPQERYQLKALKDSGLSIRGIANVLKRSPSTISREIIRNSRECVYYAKKANRLARARRKIIGPPPRIDLGIKIKINYLLSRLQWSPQQISNSFSLSGITVCAETIYKHIYSDYKSGGKIYLNLRRRRQWRRSHKTCRNFKNRGVRVNQDSIKDRPKIVEKRKRIGDLERDTMLGKAGSPVLLTIVDRTTRLTRIAKVDRLNAELTHRATLKLLANSTVNTITNDNGPEFSWHKITARKLNTKIYFNNPYSSWERGTNENTNGLIRQYYPKGHDFNLVSNAQIKRIETLLNNRPRKCLAYKTPLQVHRELSRVLR